MDDYDVCEKCFKVSTFKDELSLEVEDSEKLRDQCKSNSTSLSFAKVFRSFADRPCVGFCIIFSYLYLDGKDLKIIGFG